MVSEEVGVDDSSTGRPRTAQSRGRRHRLLAPAVTPLRVSDLAAGVASHVRGTGRDRFRETIARVLDADRTATYTSYRRALGACFRELASGAGDRGTVLIPAFCSYDFPHAVEGVGLSVERYDVAPQTLTADLDSLETGVLDDALALVSVAPLGYGPRMDALAARCDATDTYLVETLGYALGTEYRGRRLGTFGDCTVLNFQQGKPVPVGGGMVASRTDAVALDDAGREAVAPNAGTLAGYTLLSRPRGYALYDALSDLIEATDVLADRATTHPGSTGDVAYEPPFDTMSGFQGAVARRTFERLPEHRRERARTARFYADTLQHPRVEHLRPVAGLSKHNFVRYPLLVDPPSLRERLRDALGAVGVQTSRLYDWPPVDADRFPGAARLQDAIVTLPTHPFVDDRDRQRIADTVGEVTADYDASP
jgi:perosamine synthetase